MKEYDLIVIGTGSATNILGSMIGMNPDMKIAIIDKDEPGHMSYPGVHSLQNADLSCGTGQNPGDLLPIRDRRRAKKN